MAVLMTSSAQTQLFCAQAQTGSSEMVLNSIGCSQAQNGSNTGFLNSDCT